MNAMRSPYDPPKKCIPEDPEAGRLAEAIRRETSKGAQHVIGVVGLAHVKGILDNLQTMKTSDTFPVRLIAFFM